jgi:Sensors of blue-light using FAD
MKIYELIYYSVASPSLNSNDISNILEVSKENNSKNNITGCMLYHNDAFIQILEGNQDVIETLYSKIEKDERHYNARLVYNDTKEERLFKDWSMAFYDLDKVDTDDKGKLSFRENFITISNQTGPSTVASQLFWHISNQIISE